MAIKLEYTMPPGHVNEKMSKLIALDLEKMIRRRAEIEAYHEGFKDGIFKAIEVLIRHTNGQEDEA